MCCLSPSRADAQLSSPAVPQPRARATHPAHLLGPAQRQELAVQALAGTTSLTALAEHAQVSRTFVYQRMAIADEALQQAFAPVPTEDEVLFQLPVTKPWLRQLTLGLVLIGHCPLRGVVELFRDFFDYSIALGTVPGIVQSAVEPARQRHDRQDLSGVRVGAHDEIVQHRQPVLVGADALTTYCYLLRYEDHRDGDTWGVHLLDLRQRGLNPDSFMADAGSGLRAGLAAAFPEHPCRSDVFHALHEMHQVVTTLEHKALRAIKTCDELAHKSAARQHRGLPTDHALIRRLGSARQEQTPARELADQVACLARWLQQDVRALAGPCHAERRVVFDFIRTALHARVAQAPKLLHTLVTSLTNQRDDLLDFAAQLDRDCSALAGAVAVAPDLIRDLFAVQTLDVDNPSRWHRDAKLRRVLGERSFLLSQALAALTRWTVRASSVVENLNSRLRDYFFLRQTLGNDYLALLPFFLNHRRFLRSEHPERVDKSPAALLTGQQHPHWVELLGYARFARP